MAKKLAKNVTVGNTTYGPDYPQNKLPAEVRKDLEKLKVWDEPEPDEEESETDTPSVSQMNKAQLQTRATELEIEFEQNATNDELRHLIEDKLAGAGA